MRTFGGFRLGDDFFYGEVIGDEVHVLENPYWIDVEPSGKITKLDLVQIGLPVAPSKLIAVGLNYADHMAEMKRAPLGTPLIWFKAPSSLLPQGFDQTVHSCRGRSHFIAPRRRYAGSTVTLRVLSPTITR